jgi:hypothetical protein
MVTRDLAEIKAFRAEHGDIVMKPLYGKGGGRCSGWRAKTSISAHVRSLHRHLREQWVVQKFPAGGEGRRQAHHPGRRRVRRRRSAACRRPICAPTWCVAAHGETGLTARERDLRASGRRCANAGSSSSAST